LTDILANKLPASEIPATAITTLRDVSKNPVGALDLLQMMAAVTWLPARLAPRWTPQAPRRRRLRVPI
jgi:hypothetical protein